MMEKILARPIPKSLNRDATVVVAFLAAVVSAALSVCLWVFYIGEWDTGYPAFLLAISVSVLVLVRALPMLTRNTEVVGALASRLLKTTLMIAALVAIALKLAGGTGNPLLLAPLIGAMATPVAFAVVAYQLLRDDRDSGLLYEILRFASILRANRDARSKQRH